MAPDYDTGGQRRHHLPPPPPADFNWYVCTKT